MTDRLFCARSVANKAKELDDDACGDDDWSLGFRGESTRFSSKSSTNCIKARSGLECAKDFIQLPRGREGTKLKLTASIDSKGIDFITLTNSDMKRLREAWEVVLLRRDEKCSLLTDFRAYHINKSTKK